MSNFKPITTRAKCDYSSLPVNQEVTVDAKGTTPVKLGYQSPLKAKIPASPAKQTKPINRRGDSNSEKDKTVTVSNAIDQVGDLASKAIKSVGDIKLSTPEGRQRRQERRDLRKQQSQERSQQRIDQNQSKLDKEKESNSPAKQTKKANVSKSTKPSVEYTNMRMMNSIRTQDAQGIRQAKPATPTARDSASYREGFNFGVKNWQNPPEKGFPWENEMFRGGRWEGQNKAKKLAENQSPNKKRYCKK
jgi:hypothetical protein